MLSYRAKRRLSLLVLLVGLPLYIIVAVTLINWIDSNWGRQPIWLELVIYAVLGIVWVLPFRALFRGIGKDAPEE
ncbi:MAG: DUF2842 domain-containing protein [Albidovulum sp.]|jgi:predicted membrane channel-forming protein YqfA (hemolysin III family)